MGWGGKGGAKRGQKSAGFFLFPQFCSSQGQTRSRPDLDVLHQGTRPSLLCDRGDIGPRDGRVTEERPAARRLPLQQELQAPQPHPRTRETGPSWAHTTPRPHAWHPAPPSALCTRQHRAPEPRCVCTKKPLPLANKLSCIFPFSTSRSNVFQEFNYI